MTIAVTECCELFFNKIVLKTFDEHGESSEVEPDKLTSFRQSVAAITSTLYKVNCKELELKKARIKELWRISCRQLAEYDCAQG